MTEVWTMTVPTVTGHYWHKAEPEMPAAIVHVDGNKLRMPGMSYIWDVNHFHFQLWGPMVPQAAELEALVSLARKAMIAAMESYSEEYYAAGWATGLEYALWERIHRTVDKDNFTDVDSEEFTIAAMSTVTNGWVVYDHILGDPKWIPMSEWEEILKSPVRVD